ncbi:unnamed protein product [Cercospora beticola]|nr:unnamed protein product [Cercospora beticola]
MICSWLFQVAILAFAALCQAGALPASIPEDRSTKNDVPQIRVVPQVNTIENEQSRIPAIDQHDSVRYEDLVPSEPMVTSLPVLELDDVVHRPIVHVTSFSTEVRKREAAPTNAAALNS